jgi:hypothetical protein
VTVPPGEIEKGLVEVSLYQHARIRDGIRRGGAIRSNDTRRAALTRLRDSVYARLRPEKLIGEKEQLS